MKTYAIIPTRDRADMLQSCVDSIRSQVEKVIIINTRPDGERVWDFDDKKIVELFYPVGPNTPVNISHWWNMGIKLAGRLRKEDPEWNCLILNDDTVSPANIVEALSTSMRCTSAVLASPNMFDNRVIFHDETSMMMIHTRVTGYAFMLRGEAGLSIDESMAWWWSDTDIEYQARRNGGSILVPGCRVEHLDANGYTTREPGLTEQTLRDREAFERKWGRAPW